MGTAKVSGYGIKVTADDPGIDVRGLAERISKVNPEYERYVDSFFKDYPEITDFSFLAFSFLNLIDNEFPLLHFVFLNDGDESFAVVLRDYSSEVMDGTDPSLKNDFVDFYDRRVMRLWVQDFFPGYEDDWIFEEIAPDFVGLWKTDDGSDA